MTSAAAIAIEDLVRDFGEVRALDGLSLTVPRAGVFGFLGPNGSGKTTTIRVLLGLLEPTSGQAQVLGFDVDSESADIRERTGVLLEHHGLDERLSAFDNLEFWGRIWRMDARARNERNKELLQSMALWERRHDRVGQWSYGMKKRLALARAVLPGPELLLLDEPTAGLDVGSAAAVRQDLASLASRMGITVFLSTHNMAEAEELCESLAIIRKGALVAVGSPHDLRAQAARPRIEVIGRGFTPELRAAVGGEPHVFSVAEVDGRLIIEFDGPADPAPVVARLVGAGGAVQEVRRLMPSLEDVFLHLTEEQPDHTEGSGPETEPEDEEESGG